MMTLRIKEDATVAPVLLPKALRGVPPGVALVVADRKSGRRLLSFELNRPSDRRRKKTIPKRKTDSDRPKEGKAR
jgi:hypothetical protein